MQVSQVGFPEDFKGSRKQEEQEKRKKHIHAEEMSHSGAIHKKGYVKVYKSICNKYGVQAYFKGGNTLKNLLMFPKDKDETKKQSNIIYWYRCGRTECDDEYIGESARTFEERFKEHLKAPSPIYEHGQYNWPQKHQWRTKIIGREGHGISRTIQEAIYIRVNNPTLNRNADKYNLPHI